MWFVASDGFKKVLLIGKVSLGCPTLHCIFLFFFAVRQASGDLKETAKETCKSTEKERTHFLSTFRDPAANRTCGLPCKVLYELEAFLHRKKKIVGTE